MVSLWLVISLICLVSLSVVLRWCVLMSSLLLWCVIWFRLVWLCRLLIVIWKFVMLIMNCMWLSICCNCSSVVVVLLSV